LNGVIGTDRRWSVRREPTGSMERGRRAKKRRRSVDPTDRLDELGQENEPEQNGTQHLKRPHLNFQLQMAREICDLMKLQEGKLWTTDDLLSKFSAEIKVGRTLGNLKNRVLDTLAVLRSVGKVEIIKRASPIKRKGKKSPPCYIYRWVSDAEVRSAYDCFANFTELHSGPLPESSRETDVTIKFPFVVIGSQGNVTVTRERNAVRLRSEGNQTLSVKTDVDIIKDL